MANFNFIKRVLRMAVPAVIFAGLACPVVACGAGPVEKSGVLTTNSIEGIEKTEYVFCVSRQSANAGLYVNELNAVIASVDCDDLIGRYMAQTNKREDFLGELTVEDNTGDPINIYTSVLSPYQFSGAYGNGVDGVDMYLMVKLADDLEMKPNFNDLPYTAAYNYVKEGRGDILASAVALTDEVKEDFLVTDVYSSGYQQIVSDKNENFSKLSDLKGLRIGVLEGREGCRIIEEAIERGALKDSGAEAVVYGTDAEAYSEYLAEQCDVLVLDEYSAKYLLRS